MTLFHILAFAVVLLLARLVPRWRGWILLAGSALAVFWLQPALPVRGLDFWLPAGTLALAALGWLATASPETRALRENWIAGLLLAGVVLLAGLTRFLGPDPSLTASRPPPLPGVLAGLALLAGLLLALTWLARRPAAARALPAALIFLLLALFIVLKSPALAQSASAGLRALAGQSAALATPLDLRWLGFSYLAFRLIHTARDRQSGRLPAVSLREYLTYALFFPALTAGPIDRVERFVKDLRAAPPASCDPAAAAQLGLAGQRLAVGLFKKFALAAALALVALDAQSAGQVRSTGAAWVLVYAYALLIYFDFSGYTDIAIGLGLLAGVKLPENFNAPYLKPNLTQFWNNWHMTLTQWFRAYYFNPLTRTLRGRARPLPAVAVIFITQLSTMLLIGLWHGVSWNFVLWGAWHGLGMFVHNRWSDFARARFPGPQPKALAVLGTVFTFHFVALGWVFFVLPTPDLAWRVLRLLFGV